MGKILVPKAELAALVGLAPDVDDATLNRAINETIARADAQKDAERQAARNRELEDADKRLVAAAVRQGKFPDSRSRHYLSALKVDRDGTTRVIAALAAVPLIAAQNASRPRPATVEEIARRTGAPFDRVVTSDDQLNAAIEADPEMHRAVWAIGGAAGGLKPPPERIFVYPEVETPWNPKPKLVMHEDGTGHWESPPPDPNWLGT